MVSVSVSFWKSEVWSVDSWRRLSWRQQRPCVGCKAAPRSRGNGLGCATSRVAGEQARSGARNILGERMVVYRFSLDADMKRFNQVKLPWWLLHGARQRAPILWRGARAARAAASRSIAVAAGNCTWWDLPGKGSEPGACPPPRLQAWEGESDPPINNYLDSVLKPRTEWFLSLRCLKIFGVLREYQVHNCLEF